MDRRSLFIDAAVFLVLTPDEEHRLSQVSLLGDYLAGKRQELLAWNEALGRCPSCRPTAAS